MNSDTNSESLAPIKAQLFTLLVALVVISGTLAGYLYTQASIAGKELSQGQQLSTQLKQNEMAMNNFLTQLVAYGQKHPEFQPVLKKYGIIPPPAGVVSPAPVVPKK